MIREYKGVWREGLKGMGKIVEASNIVESKLSGADRNDGGGCDDDNDDGGGGGGSDDYGARMLAGVAEEEATGIEGR